MTDVETAPVAEGAQPTGEPTVDAGGRGRPRPQETLERDEQVLNLLARAPHTKEELAAALGVKPGIAYLCLYRLRRAGKVEKIVAGENVDARRPRWQLKTAG